jgi:hypothetical protein
MTNPSPLRKIIPPLVWPVGILMLVGYCFIGERTLDRSIALEDRQEVRDLSRARSPESRPVVVQGQGGELRSVHASARRETVAEFSSLRIPLIVILGVVLVVAVVWRTNSRDRAERERAANETS